MSHWLLEVTRYESVPAAVQRWIDSLDSPGEILILASTRAAADELARTLSLGNQGRMGLHRWTPAQLAAVLATPELAKAGLAPLSRLGLEALAARASYRSREADSAGYFAPVSGMPGFSRSLASTLLDLRLAQARGDRLAQCSRGGPDLAILLELYTEELQTHSLADRATLLELAAGALERESPWSGLPVVLLDAPPRSRAEFRFYGSLIGGSPATLALVLPGDEPGMEAFRTLLEVSAPTFPRNGEETGAAALGRIRSSLFAAGEVAGGSMDPSFRLFSAVGEGHECVEITRSLLEEAKRGTAFDQMAVLLRNPESYQPQMEEALARAGIPGYFGRGISRPDPAGRALLTLLECAEEGLTASRFAEYLSLGQVPRDHPSPERFEQEPPWAGPGEDLEMSFKSGGNAPAATDGDSDPEDDRSPVIAGTLRTPAHWERLLVDAAVIGGRDRWESRLAGLESDLMSKRRIRGGGGRRSGGTGAPEPTGAAPEPQGLRPAGHRVLGKLSSPAELAGLVGAAPPAVRSGSAPAGNGAVPPGRTGAHGAGGTRDPHRGARGPEPSPRRPETGPAAKTLWPGLRRDAGGGVRPVLPGGLPPRTLGGDLPPQGKRGPAAAGHPAPAGLDPPSPAGGQDPGGAPVVAHRSRLDLPAPHRLLPAHGPGAGTVPGPLPLRSGVDARRPGTIAGRPGNWNGRAPRPPAPGSVGRPPGTRLGPSTTPSTIWPRWGRSCRLRNLRTRVRGGTCSW